MIRACRVGPVRVGALVGALLALAGGSAARAADQPSSARSCPGAVVCPYSRVSQIGQAGNGVLRDPQAIALGPAGDVYVADQFSHVVQRFSTAGTFEGQWGSYGWKPGEFGAIGGLAVDTRGDVYVVDSSSDRIQKFDATGHYLTSWGSGGERVGQFHFGRGGGPELPPGGGIAIGGGYVYVADTQNDRIERFGLDGKGAMVLAGAGQGRARLSYPRGLAISDNELYVADSARVVALNLKGQFVGQTPGGGPVAQKLSAPFGIALHGPLVYVVDDNNGRIVELGRQLSYVSAFSGTGEAQFSPWLRAVAVDAAGNIYVADTGHSRVEVFSPSGGLLRTWGKTAFAAGALTLPLDVATGPTGNVVVVATNGLLSPIQVFSRSFDFLSTWYAVGSAPIGHHWFSPSAVAVGPDGSVWVTDRNNDLIRHLSATGTQEGTIGAPGGGHAPGALEWPNGVAVGPTGNVYVADTGNNRVQEFAPDGKLLAGDLGASAAGYRQLLHGPRALAVDGSGDVYLADTDNDRVVVLGPGGGFVRAWGSTGSKPGRLHAPDGIVVDSRGHVFVTDRDNNRIEEFTTQGKFLAAWGTTGAGPGELNFPAGLALDCQGDLLVADTKNNRVEVFSGVASVSSAACS
jgi:tripartite motif-containing protein 71